METGGDKAGSVRAEGFAPSRGVVRSISIAPMLDRTDRHFRFMMRLITRQALFYTEMIAASAVVHGKPDRFLAFNEVERPLAVQFGGDDPASLAAAAAMAEDRGFDEINLNVGCPSDRVQRGRMGACLMLDAARVAAIVDRIRSTVALPVTVKHRIGVDRRDRFEDLCEFVETVADAGADRFTVHARKAWLSGLSPKQNREIPPLRYADVYKLKREFPHLIIEINGGVTTPAAALEHLEAVDAVMIGRAAYDTPCSWFEVDRIFFGEHAPAADVDAIIDAMTEYARAETEKRTPAGFIVRPMLGLWNGRPGARAWRRTLSDSLAAGWEAADAIAAAREARHEAAEASGGSRGV